jgi:hypothetical protein
MENCMTIGRINEENVLMDIREGLEGRHEAVIPYGALSQGRGDRPV